MGDTNAKDINNVIIDNEYATYAGILKFIDKSVCSKFDICIIFK